LIDRLSADPELAGEYRLRLAGGGPPPELDALAHEYTRHSEACGVPAILATLRSARGGAR